MKYDRARLALAMAIAVPLWIICATGCATARGPSDYDGGSVDIQPTEDSVRIKIENHRTRDATDPRFYLVSAGTHGLGIVRGINGRLDRSIPRNWLTSDGCMSIAAHYAGGTTFTFDAFCMRRGEIIDVSLDDIFNPVAAWSHR